MYMNIARVMMTTFYVASASYLLYNIFYLRKRRPINEAIMFSWAQVLRKSIYSRHLITTSMDRLLHYLNSPRYTLDICMFVILNKDMVKCVIKQHSRGINVRVIMDGDFAYRYVSILRKLEIAGIEVRWVKSDYEMHHKFCVIDKNTVEQRDTTPIVICGSLDWTDQCLCGNWDDVSVTSQEELVEAYKTEFDRLWEQFIPI